MGTRSVLRSASARRIADLCGGLQFFLADRRASAAVEFAIIGPFVIFLTLGAVELSRAVWAQASIDHAAQETVRFASVRGAASSAIASSSQLETMALQTADLDPAKTTANVTWNPDNLPGSVVTVQMQHTFTHINLPFTLPAIALNSTASLTIVR